MPKQYPTRASLHRPAPAGPVAAAGSPAVDDGATLTVVTAPRTRTAPAATQQAAATPGDAAPATAAVANRSLPTRAERRRREQAALEATALMAPVDAAPVPDAAAVADVSPAPDDTGAPAQASAPSAPSAPTRRSARRPATTAPSATLAASCAAAPQPGGRSTFAATPGAVAAPRWAPLSTPSSTPPVEPAPGTMTAGPALRPANPTFPTRAERRAATGVAPALPGSQLGAQSRPQSGTADSACLPTPAAAFPSRAERRRAAVLPADVPEPVLPSARPAEPATEVLSRAARREAELPSAGRRKADRAHRTHTGSLVAVAGALLVATVVVDPLSAAVPNDDDYRLVAEALEAIAERGGTASRAGDRVDLADQPTGAASAATPESAAIAAAQEVLDRASAVVATESRATPEQRDEVVAKAALVRELVNRLNAGADVAADPDLVEVVDAKLTSTAVTAGKDPSDARDPEVLASAISTATAELALLLDAAAPVAVAVEPRPMTAAEVREQQAAEGRADAPRLEQYRLATAGFENGRLPMRIMSELSWAPGHFLRPDAAAQLERLNIAFHAEFGVNLSITDSYRSFEGQVRARRNRGRMAAIPGFSNHGWGVAVDLGGGINRFRTAEHRWMREHAEEFGWTLPGWARERGSKPEPWHWEFEGAPDSYGD